MHIFYHDDYDGAASAALISSWWNHYVPDAHPVKYQSVNYWNSSWEHRLPVRNDELVAIVDFKYNPRADIWFDHHSTAFASNEQRAEFRPSQWRVWNPAYPSCASLIHAHLRDSSTIPPAWGEEFKPLVEYATKIDTANYDSVDEYLLGDHPAIRYDQVWPELSEGQKAETIRRFMRLQLDFPKELAPLLKRVRSRNQQSLDQFQYNSRQQENVAILDGLSKGIPNVRFAGFKLYPGADYAVTSFKAGSDVVITLGRNPWKDNLQAEPVHLGLLAAEFGGGGHERAAGITIKLVDHDHPGVYAINVVSELKHRLLQKNKAWDDATTRNKDKEHAA